MTDKHPAPSPEGRDPHPAREETSAQTSPETGPSSSPRTERELRDDRKLNGYVHDGRDRTEGLVGTQTGPAQADAIDEPDQAPGDRKRNRAGETGETLPEAPFRKPADAED